MINLVTFFLSILFIKSQYGQRFTREMIEDPKLYKNEICSYNGIPEIDNDKIFCHCYASYVNEPNEKKVKYINGQMVQCSYQKKKRFKTFFLAGILPMGFDLFYLGYKLYFSIVFIAIIIVIANNIIHFYLTYQLDEKQEEKHKNYDINENFGRNVNIWNQVDKKKKEKDRNKRCLNIYGFINKICLAFFLIYWVINVILQAKGIIKDSNGIETDNDMDTLFSREDI